MVIVRDKKGGDTIQREGTEGKTFLFDQIRLLSQERPALGRREWAINHPRLATAPLQSEPEAALISFILSYM